MKDRLTPQQRSYCMSKVKTKNTDIESCIRKSLRKKGLKFSTNVKNLPGKPDIVFQKERIAIFIDGDFWHGYRFNQWKTTLSPFWKYKIEANIFRDKRNFAKLRRRGWKVCRVWEIQIKKDLDKIIEKILLLHRQSSQNRSITIASSKVRR